MLIVYYNKQRLLRGQYLLLPNLSPILPVHPKVYSKMSRRLPSDELDKFHLFRFVKYNPTIRLEPK